MSSLRPSALQVNTFSQLRQTHMANFNLCLHSGTCLLKSLDTVNGVEEALVQNEGIPLRRGMEKELIQTWNDK